MDKRGNVMTPFVQARIRPLMGQHSWAIHAKPGLRPASIAAVQIVAIAQRIMRHRDIKLTAEAYLDEGLLPLSAAMAALPRFSAASA
jgi:hypothetical protein